MAFNIIDVETGAAVRYVRREGLAQFETPQRASLYAKRRGQRDGKRYKIKAAVNDDSWIEREKTRMNDGTYIYPPWTNETWDVIARGAYTKDRILGLGYDNLLPILGATKHHFAHVSMNNKSMLAYTESPEKGARDIQTQINPGSYLAKYFGGKIGVLSDEPIAAWVRNWQSKYQDCTLLFARTAAEIVDVYQRGPNSCMTQPADKYQTKDMDGDYRHPCEVYGQPHSDLTLAYLQVSSKRVISRCLVWESKKQHGRIYGDDTLLRRELNALGYKPGGFEGAKLAKIPLRLGKRTKSFLMPYVDGWSNVLDQDDHFLITSKRASRKQQWYCCSSTCGNTGEYRVYECHECHDEILEENTRSVNDHYYCADCCDAKFIYCQYYSTYMDKEGSAEVVISSGRRCNMWCAKAIKRLAFLCPIENRYYHRDLGVMHEGKMISAVAHRRMTEPPPPQPKSALPPIRLPIDWATGGLEDDQF